MNAEIIWFYLIRGRGGVIRGHKRITGQCAVPSGICPDVRPV